MQGIFQYNNVLFLVSYGRVGMWIQFTSAMGYFRASIELWSINMWYISWSMGGDAGIDLPSRHERSRWISVRPLITNLSRPP